MNVTQNSLNVTPPARPRLTRREALRRAGVAGLGAGLLPVLLACGGDDDNGDDEAAEEETAPPEAAGEHVVEMNDELEFVPDQLTIKVGETVTWTTVDAIPHTSTADPDKANDPAYVKLPEGAEPWDSGLVNQGESWSRTFEVPGEYAYFCIPHQAAGMLATLTVTE